MMKNKIIATGKLMTEWEAQQVSYA
jgi:hypothetical protein